MQKNKSEYKILILAILLIVVLFLVFSLNEKISTKEEIKKSPEIKSYQEMTENLEFNFKSNEPMRDKLGLVTYNLPTGVYTSREGQTLFHKADETKDILDLNAGYIIEFVEPTVIDMKLELVTQGRQQEEINDILDQYRNDLLSNHNNFKNEASRILNKEIKVREEFTYVLNGVSLDINQYDSEKIKNLPNIKRVVKNRIVQAVLMDSVPLIRANEVWNLGYTGLGIKIAIIDTGVDYTHPDLGGCFGAGCKVAGGYDFVNNDNDPKDDHFHGTHVASIAAGQGTLNGVAKDAKIYAYKVLTSDGWGYWDWVIAGIERAVQDNVDIISMSLGGYCELYRESCGPDDPVSVASDRAAFSGVVVVVAAGNEWDQGSIDTPGTSRKAITVGATYKRDYSGFYWGDDNPRVNQIPSFSSKGPVIGDNFGLVKPDVVAPGAIICASRYDNVFPAGQNQFYFPCLDNQHVQLAGTSMAAPHVAGLAALIVQKNPNWNPDEVKMAIRNKANNLYNLFGYSIIEQGYGAIDSLNSIQSTKQPVAYINTSGKVHGLDISIKGIAKSDNFASYSLYYSNGYNYDIQNVNWIQICSNTQQVINNQLCNWNVRNINDGEFTIKLVVNGNNQQSTDYVFMNLRNTEITYPVDLNFIYSTADPRKEIFPTWKSIRINGTSIIDNFQRYNIQWRREDGGSWSANGITLRNNGMQSIINGELGTFDPVVIDRAGFYHIELTTYNQGGGSSYYVIKIYVDPSIHEGWPRRYLNPDVNEGGWLRWAYSYVQQPTVVDLNNDGNKDLISAYDDLVFAVDHLGESLPGWPVEIYENCPYFPVQIGPAVGDLNNDGRNEVVVGDSCGSLHILRDDGSYVNDPYEPFGIGYLQEPAIGDLNNDNLKEVVIMDYASNLIVANHNGQILPNWPKLLDLPQGYEYNIPDVAPAIADIDGDGSNEIIIYSLGFSPECCNPGDSMTRVWVLNYDGTNVPGWPKDLYGFDSVLMSNIAVADLNNDNQLEIISRSYSGKLYVWNPDGTNLNGWPIQIGSPNFEFQDVFNEISVGDINNDGLLEIAMIISLQRVQYVERCLAVVNNQGYLLNGFPLCWENEITYTGHPTILNNDLDTKLEISANTHGNAPYYLVGHYSINDDTSIVNKFPKLIDDVALLTVVPADDIDSDGKTEMILGLTFSGSSYVWDLDGANAKSWPMYQHDPQHTGTYPSVNKAKNPSFEIDSGIDFYPNWSEEDSIANNNKPDGFRSTSNGILDGNIKYQGYKSLKIITNNDRAYSYQDIPVEYNKRYRVSGYVKTDCSDNNCYGTILSECENINHQPIWDYNTCKLNINPINIRRLYNDNDWTYIEFDVENNRQDAKFLRVLCYNTPGPLPVGSGVVWCDSFNVIEIPRGGGIGSPIFLKSIVQGTGD